MPAQEQRETRTSFSSITGKNLSHAYLLTGSYPSLLTAGQALARRILVDLGGSDPLRFDSGNCPDLIHVEEETIRVDRIRELIRSLFVQPLEGRYRVFLLDYAGDMSAVCQNALLKSLEEPPGYVVWLLLSNNRAKLLPTVQSRLQEVNYRIDRSRGRSLEDLFPLLEGALRGNLEPVFCNDRGMKTWSDQEDIFDRILLYFQKLLAFQTGSLEETLAFPLQASLEKVAPDLPLARISRAMDWTEQTRQRVNRLHLNRRLALEHLLLMLGPSSPFQ